MARVSSPKPPGRERDGRTSGGVDAAPLSTGALAAGLFPLGCVPAQEVPGVPPLTVPVGSAVPVEVTQLPDGSIALTGAPAPGTDRSRTLTGAGKKLSSVPAS